MTFRCAPAGLGRLLIAAFPGVRCASAPQGAQTAGWGPRPRRRSPGLSSVRRYGTRSRVLSSFGGLGLVLSHVLESEGWGAPGAVIICKRQGQRSAVGGQWGAGGNCRDGGFGWFPEASSARMHRFWGRGGVRDLPGPEMRGTRGTGRSGRSASVGSGRPAESPGFSSASPGFFGANVLFASQSASGAIQSPATGAEGGDSG